jgi:hypothetical protein
MLLHLLQLYSEEGLKVNDAIEVVGVLSVDPSLAEFNAEHGE